MAVASLASSCLSCRDVCTGLQGQPHGGCTGWVFSVSAQTPDVPTRPSLGDHALADVVSLWTCRRVDASGTYCRPVRGALLPRPPCPPCPFSLIPAHVSGSGSRLSTTQAGGWMQPW